MGVPDDFDVDVDLSLGGSLAVDAGLDNIGIGVSRLPKIEIGVDDLKIDAGLNDVRIRELAPIRVTADASIQKIPKIEAEIDAGLDNIRADVDLGLDNIRLRELAPIQLEIGIRPTRVHFPVNMKISGSLLGCEIWSLSTCGESMVIVEDYVAHETEQCR